ncbi:SDR family oxidoreductase (plasmid) [Streptomyces globisporus]|uniref:SDR family oxidoreductase n=1 Tax=Streptomyces globisporus TaxID=1908 RepID=UPI002F915754|nr:SDR family oxidoreductase [Streptomyces globisporus]
MNRSVLITGGNRGIGLAIAEAFLKAGDRVAVAQRGSGPSLTGTLAVRCDVTDAEQIDAAFRTVEAEHGPVEILVSNAGVTYSAPLATMTEEQFTSVVDTNLTGAYRVARRASRGMVRARSGRMIFVSSVLGTAGRQGAGNYAASKAGLIGLARSIAREYAGYGITANLVSPGLVRTTMIDDMPDAMLEELLSRTFLKRPAEPEEVAATVVWLAEEESRYITGAEIPVDGGLGLGA